MTLYDLDERPSYQELSLICGESVQECPVYCEGRMLFITRRAGEALRRLIYGKLSRHIWVDSVCIYSNRSQIKYGRNLRFKV